MLKAGLAALDYDLLVYLDVDAVVVRPPSPTVLGMKGWEMFSYTVENAPISGGDFLLRPSHGAFHDMMRLMDVGFSRELGWGKLGLPVEKWSGLHCQFASNHRYCQEKPDFNHWDFLAAEGDKGNPLCVLWAGEAHTGQQELEAAISEVGRVPLASMGCRSPGCLSLAVTTAAGWKIGSGSIGSCMRIKAARGCRA